MAPGEMFTSLAILVKEKRRSNSIDRKLRKLWPTLKTNAALVSQKCQTLPSIIMTLVVNAFPSENIIGASDRRRSPLHSVHGNRMSFWITELSC